MAPAVSLRTEEFIERHSMICRQLTDFWPAESDFAGKSVCEIGSGDCLAAAAFFIAKGARHVELVDLQPPVVNAGQAQVLSALKTAGFPVSLDIISDGNAPALNHDLAAYSPCRIEEYRTENRHDLIFSHNVLEHVEDLNAAFKSAREALRPGGQMVHIIDLGGHGEFEDPIPPLDFQTYPEWLFGCMYPVNYRCTRRFMEEYRRAANGAGFADIDLRPIRMADKSYVESIRKKLRPTARSLPYEQLGVIEFILSAVK